MSTNAADQRNADREYRFVLKLEIGFMGSELFDSELNYAYDKLDEHELWLVSNFLSRRLTEVHNQIHKLEDDRDSKLVESY